MSTIAKNIAKVRTRIREAAQACGRDPETVGLLAVSKTKPAAAVREAHACGQRDFGENYLQEAGRAGRDQAPARCVLLYDEADLDVQFRLLKNSRLTQHDIGSILKALRTIERKDRSDGEVVVTSGEILLEIPEASRIDPDASDADTKVRIAVAWLEEARLLERHGAACGKLMRSTMHAGVDGAVKIAFGVDHEALGQAIAHRIAGIERRAGQRLGGGIRDALGGHLR